jgi:hypothetical protein
MIQLFEQNGRLVTAEVAQGLGELEVYKLTQKSGVYSVRAINKHH